MATYITDVNTKDIGGVATTLTLPAVNADGSGGDGIMLGIVWRDLGETVTSVTFNGSASGWVHGIGAKISIAGIAADFYYAVGLTGTHDIVITWSGVGGLLAANASVFSGVNQSTPIGTPVTSDSTGGIAASVSDTATGESGGAGFDVLGLRDDLIGESLAPGGSQTQRGTQDDTGSAGASWSTAAGAVSQQMSWTWTNTMNYVHIVVPLRAVGGGGGTVPVFMAHRRTQEMS